MSVINTNITSMIGQQNLSKSQNDLATSMERLSSGLRINSAKDDAAGQAIANRMSAQITGLSTAQRNANDGISVAQTAEGGLNQINDNLQRIRELSVQAQNGTNSGNDLDSIQAEIDQRLTEIDRISKETDFNGTKVLGENTEGANPALRTLSIQVGANDTEVIEIDLQQMDRTQLGLDGFNINDADVDNRAATTDMLTDAGYTSVAQANGTVEWSNTETTTNDPATSENVLDSLVDTNSVNFAGNSALGVAADGNSYVYNAGTESFTYNATGSASTAVDSYIQAKATEAGEPVEVTVTLGGSEQKALVASDGTMTTLDNQTLYFDASNNLTTTNAGTETQANISEVSTYAAGGDGDTIEIGGTTFTGANGTTANTMDATGATISKDAFDTAQAGTGFSGGGYTVDAAGGVTLTSTGAAVNFNAESETLTTDATTDVTTTYYEQSSGMITDGAGAQLYVDSADEFTFEATTEGTANADPLKTLDDALAKVDTLRSDLGAIQNRFESAITNLQTNETNLSAARSRIEDADYATEVANMTRAQILQQAGTSVLAQANQIPQSVLSLLG